MRKRKNPPQGTSSIHNPEKEDKLLDWGANNMLDEIFVHLRLHRDLNDDDYWALIELKREGRMTDERAAPYLTALYAKHPRWVVGKAYKHLKYSSYDSLPVRNENDS